MSYAELDRLVSATFDCFKAADVPFTRDPDYEVAPGFLAPAYSYGEPLAAADACINENSFFAEQAYQTQPSVQQLRDEALLAEKPQVLECLRAHGFEIDEKAPLDEVRQAVRELFLATVDSEPVLCTEYP